MPVAVPVLAANGDDLRTGAGGPGTLLGFIDRGEIGCVVEVSHGTWLPWCTDLLYRVWSGAPGIQTSHRGQGRLNLFRAGLTHQLRSQGQRLVPVGLTAGANAPEQV